MISEALNVCNLVNIITKSNSVDCAWNAWLSQIHSVIKANVPVFKIGKRTDPPWFNSDVRHLIKQRNTAWRRAKSTGTHPAWCRYKRLRNRVQRVLRENHSLYINQLGIKVKENPKTFWSYIKHKTGQGSIPETIVQEGVNVSDSMLKARAFNQYFQSVFNKSDMHCNFPICSPVIETELSDTVISEETVLTVLMSLDVKKQWVPIKYMIISMGL